MGEQKNTSEGVLTSRGSRSRMACGECKRRRIKCSGPPGICGACTDRGSFCHFNIRLDTRRKNSITNTEVLGCARSVLDGLLLGLRFNSTESLEQLLEALRAPQLSPQILVKKIQEQQKMLKNKGFATGDPIGDDDLHSIALDIFVNSRNLNTATTELPKDLNESEVFLSDKSSSDSDIADILTDSNIDAMFQRQPYDLDLLMPCTGAFETFAPPSLWTGSSAVNANIWDNLAASSGSDFIESWQSMPPNDIPQVNAPDTRNFVAGSFSF